MEVNINYSIVQIIKNFLGNPNNESDSLNKKQWQFNCPGPSCRHDSGKFNLEYNSEKKAFKCWKCEPSYSGYIHKLVKDYGSRDDLHRLNLIYPQEDFKNFKEKEVRPKKLHELITCKLPEGYFPLGRTRNTLLYNLAWDYLVKERKVSPSIIDKYQIGYTESGPRKHRIIIPSFNSLGHINYYEARSYMKGPKVIPYIKPSSEEVHKNDIIFNEYFINWNLPVFLVEGAFDMFRIPNSIALLGKEISQLLIDLLVKNKCKVIVCLDDDAISKSIETYKILSSLGLDVFFIDLSEQKKDISKIYEDHGKDGIAKVLKTLKKINLSFEINKKLK